MISVVIMAGGSGTRFWPKSRKNVPKQCIAIVSEKTMIEEAVERMEKLTPKDNIYISTGKHLEGPMRKHLPDVNYVIEPCARNTAPCIGLSAISIMKKDPESIMAIVTADHSFADPDAFIEHMKAGVEMAKNDKIVLIGINPTYPSTGFGYIHMGDELTSEDDDIKIHDLREFKEKPDLKTAKEFLESGEYMWNSGMFISKVSVMMDAIRMHMPDLYDALSKISNSDFDEKVLEEEFEKLEKISIDYGVMEKAKNIAVVRGDFPWADVGDWKSMEIIHPKDENGNVVIGEHSGDAKNCIIVGDGKLIETADIENVVIVDTKDCLLVCSKDRVQEVKKIVEILENDPELEKYTKDLQDEFEFHKVSIDCEDLEVSSNGLVATIDVDELHIEKNDEKIMIKEVE